MKQVTQIYKTGVIEIRNVIRYQYFQDKVGELIIRVLPNNCFREEDKERIFIEHNEKFSGELDVIVECVDDIPLTVSGKQRRILCTLGSL